MAEISDDRVHRRLNATTGLSPNAPLPNIVRIEVLNSQARNRYLGTIGQFTSKTRDLAFRSSGDKGLNKFYGFMKGTPKTSFGITAKWADSGAGGGILGAITKTAGGVADLALGTGSGELKTIASSAGDIAKDLTGLNASATGSSSLKRYNGGSLKGFTLTCGWYMPEQHDLCIKSLKSILRMVYPVQAKLDAQTIQTFLRGLTEVLGGEATSSPDNSLATSTPQNPGNLSQVTPKQSLKSDAITGAANVINDLQKGATEFFGTNLTFDPLPVRVSVGQYVDIEPLVITEVNTEFSGETFINSDYRHLPIFCSVNISFDFWMMPGPNLEFMSLLGNEIFGE